MTSNIVIRGARQHNLKNIDVEIPRNRLVVITGLSGSGKSTLAFDTLYAEGQRRYVESLSAYARQFLERLEKPDVDLIEGLSPAICIEQESGGHNPRSTVGTVTEINDYLRLLFSRTGTPFCPQCASPVEAMSLDQIIDRIRALPIGSRLLILSPMPKDDPRPFSQKIAQLQRDGFSRVRVEGKVQEIETLRGVKGRKGQQVEVVVDRLVVKETLSNRLSDSVELALGQSGGSVIVHIEGAEDLLFSESATCEQCGLRFPDLSPAVFSFNTPHGACPHCGGLGMLREMDPALIVPNPKLSLREGAVAPWAERVTVHFSALLEALCRFYRADIWTPFDQLPERLQSVLLHGSGEEKIPFPPEAGNRTVVKEKAFEGIIPRLERRHKETQSSQVREEIERFMSARPCSACGGSRLNPIARAVKVGGKSLPQISELSIREAKAFFGSLAFSGKNSLIAGRLLKEIIERLTFLEDVGLHYLSLSRAANTLSGGEAQRIRLATQVGSKLSGVLYVLDEPSVGLHQRDHRRLLDTLVRMRDMGNTVMVVEHDEETILNADHVVDMGPEAGIHGGQVVFSGSPKQLIHAPGSITGQYLSGQKQIALPSKRRSGNGHHIDITGAAIHNLKHIDVRFPLGCFVCVTGVSGSGKSSLVIETLYRALCQKIYRTRTSAGTHTGITGLEHIDRVIHIDQFPIGRTPRSNPGTFTSAFSHIRELLSRTPEARARGYTPGRFSFNVKGGRCEACTGDGIVKIEMHFLPDVYVPCDVCNGKRYNRETLDIRYKGHNIRQILDMTVTQGLLFFERIEPIRSKLSILADVGLGYIQIGQSATTLSGGEAQRIKLAKELSKKDTGRTLYIMDEPTTGLHVDDIRKLLLVLERLVAAGNTVLVIEHHMDVIKTADWVIDLGPEGGDDGGQVVVYGTPEQVAGHPASLTGAYLKRALAHHTSLPDF